MSTGESSNAKIFGILLGIKYLKIMNKKLITTVRVMESTARIETIEEVFPSDYMVNNVIYEMNCRVLLPCSW